MTKKTTPTPSVRSENGGLRRFVDLSDSDESGHVLSGLMRSQALIHNIYSGEQAHQVPKHDGVRSDQKLHGQYGVPLKQPSTKPQS
jgi:hypothetical protein